MSCLLYYPNFYNDAGEYWRNFTLTLNENESPLHKAIFEKKVYLLDVQLKDPNIDVNVRNKNFETPLLSSLRITNKDVSYQLMSKLLTNPWIDVNIPDYHGDTPLHQIVKISEPISGRMLHCLLKKANCNIDKKNHFGETPLHVAETVNAVKILIEYGCDVNNKDNSENSALHTQIKNLEICKVLLENGSLINAGNIRGATPLQLAVENNKEETFFYLLQNGADPNIESCLQYRKTAIYTAFKNGASDKIKKVLWQMSKPLYLLFVASFEASKIPEIMQRWKSEFKQDDSITEFLLALINLMTFNSEFNYVTSGRLVAQFFIESTPILSVTNRKKIYKIFSEYLERSLLNFLIKTHDHSRRNSKKETKELIFIMLDCGCTIDYSDLEVIYLEYGDCKLLHDLIKLPIVGNLRKLKELPFFLRALLDVNSNLTELVRTKIVSSIEVLDFFNMHSLARYCTLSKHQQINFCDSYRNIIRFKKTTLSRINMDKCLKEIGRNNGVPTLLELSRNKVRPILCSLLEVSNAHELYQVLKKLDVAPLIINVVMMETPMFYNVPPPHYTPYDKHSFLL